MRPVWITVRHVRHRIIPLLVVPITTVAMGIIGRVAMVVRVVTAITVKVAMVTTVKVVMATIAREVTATTVREVMVTAVKVVMAIKEACNVVRTTIVRSNRSSRSVPHVQSRLSIRRYWPIRWSRSA